MLIFFSKSTFLKNSFENIIRVANILDPDQALYFVGPDLGPNCLQKLSAGDTSMKSVNAPQSRRDIVLIYSWCKR